MTRDMAKGRKEWLDLQRRRRAEALPRIWPVWARSLHAMLEADAIVRFGCFPCRRVYDVDIESLAVLRGREWSLIGRTARCKASTCRARGVFLGAASPDMAFICLTGAMPGWLIGARPRDHEAPPEGDGDGPPPPAPGGVDPERWAAADERERKRLMRIARG